MLAAGCGSEPGPLDVPPLPAIDYSAVAPIAANVLSAAVTVSGRNTDSAVVRFGTQGGPLDQVTPAIRLHDGTVTIPVLGLHPATAYTLRVTAFGASGTASGELLHLTTEALPSDLPALSAGGTDPSAGYVAFAAAGYGLVVDNTGRVVWYVRLAEPATLNFQPQPTGRYYTRPTSPTAPGLWLEIDPMGNVTRTLGCAHGLVPRFHDLIALADGSHWIMCDETRVMDLSAHGGQADARVTGTVVQHIGADQRLVFAWSPFDHFSIEDLDPAERTGATVNWTHGNAIDLDPDGNLLVSFRSLSEVTSIDTRTGLVRWRMGGRANQFAFADPLPPFRHQHGLRAAGAGVLSLLDNLGEPDGSRLERYELDEAARTVRLQRSAAPTPATVAQLGGTTQILPSDRTLVAFGNGARVQEFDQTGAMVWEIQGNPGYIFRAQRFGSLYEPGVGSGR
jgi:hypothetical protein